MENYKIEQLEDNRLKITEKKETILTEQEVERRIQSIESQSDFLLEQARSLKRDYQNLISQKESLEKELERIKANQTDRESVFDLDLE